jgi:hypothetical protein
VILAQLAAALLAERAPVPGQRMSSRPRVSSPTPTPTPTPAPPS